MSAPLPVPVDRKALALHALQIAKGYVGVSRDRDREQVTRFLEVFGLPFADQYGHPLPFCDAGFGYSTLKAYCDMQGVPYTADNAVAVFRSVLPAVQANYLYLSASCEETRQDAIRRGIWLDAGDCDSGIDILPGWAVLYNWQNGEAAHHIGCVAEDEGDLILDTEFNTSSASDGNGGAVATRSRNWNSILGFIKTY
jgi:hypothetical protein